MSELTLRPAGDRAMLVAIDDHDKLTGLVDRLRTHLPNGVQDVLPAAETVLVTFDGTATRDAIERDLRAMYDDAHAVSLDDVGPHGSSDTADTITIVVRYDGDDLADVAAHLKISPEDVVREHTSRTWRCAFIGFAPGFGYLESPGTSLILPRRDVSRTSVPAGSVALAGGYTAVYPRQSPGGWQLIGTTDAELWDMTRAEPALLRPGARVRFVDAAQS